MTHKNQIILVAAALGTCLTMAAQGSIFSDNFESYALGSGISGYDIESNWSVTTDTSFPAGAGNKAASVNGSQKNLHRIFASTTLAIGEMLYTEFDYRFTGPPTASTQSNFIRFGIYDNGPTTRFDDEVGYQSDITYYKDGTPGTGGYYGIRYEANSWDSAWGLLLDNQPGVSTAPIHPPTDSDGLGISSPSLKAANDGTTVHSVRYEIERTSGGYSMRLYVDDMTTAKATATDSRSPAPVNFSRFAIEPPFNTIAASQFHLDNLVIDKTSAVPEPEEYAVAGGLALIGFAAWRRRRQAAATAA